MVFKRKQPNDKKSKRLMKLETYTLALIIRLRVSSGDDISDQST